MSLLLHLTDLHLGDIKDSDIVGDYKSDIISMEDRANRYSLLRDTLQQLSSDLTEKKLSLDSLIISGDVTYACDEAGFQKLEEVLGWLGSIRPAADKIVIVPGNHDVRWGTTHASPERYELFLKYVRSKGYVTPLLEGIDLNGAGVFTVGISDHCVIAPDGRWAIIPINSSNFCGSEQPLDTITNTLWEELPSYLASRSKLNEKSIAGELRSLRSKDVARISTAQLLANRELVVQVRKECTKLGVPFPNLIGVVHHHLLPVSLKEEFKDFESITNLGLFRCAIREMGMSAILHGHKHVEFAYVDHVPQMLPHRENNSHSVVVISGEAPVSVDFRSGCVGRLIELQGDTLVSGFAVTNIPWTPAGATLRLPFPTSLPLDSETTEAALLASNVTAIEGTSINEVYERALTRFVEPSQIIPNLVCRVSLNGNEVVLPKAYPALEHTSDPERRKWFSDLVDWWQKNEFTRLSAGGLFNHGHRIFSYSTSGQYEAVDQIEKAIDALCNDPRTSRAIVTLLKPTVDKPESNAQFPSFCILHFVVRPGNGVFFLEAVGYFRKQEIRYWWPVNVAEISRLQKRVFDRIREVATDKLKGELRLGAITTVAAIAEVGEKIPTILVPAVDFELEVKPQLLWDITYAACWQDFPNRRNFLGAWKTVLASLVPAERQDPSGVLVPVSGIRYLADITSHFAAYHPGGSLQLAEAWRSLEELNLSHSKKMAGTNLSHDEHVLWRNQVIRRLDSIRTAVQQCFNCRREELIA